VSAAGSTVRCGWIGTGRMGAAMARRLLAHDYDVTVWNRTRGKTAALAEEGAMVADGIADLADRDVVFSTVSSSDDLLAVLSPESGLLSRPGQAPGVIIDASTVSVDASATARRLAREAGSEYLAAPVSGNPKAIAAGNMVFAISGSRSVFDEVRPVLEAIGRAAVYVGEDETARLVKLCHNLYLGVATQALIEAIALAHKAGVPRRAFMEFINTTVLGSGFTAYKVPALVDLDFTPTFTTTLLRKDFDLGLAEARELEVPMPLSAATHEIIQAAIGSGYGELDFAAMLQLQAALSGMELRSESVDE
jgi:3-hydroxyisobutyrate dehydrogenase-like beta-hydroxyacid dehydrogenase